MSSDSHNTPSRAELAQSGISAPELAVFDSAAAAVKIDVNKSKEKLKETIMALVEALVRPATHANFRMLITVRSMISTAAFNDAPRLFKNRFASRTTGS